MRTLLDCLLALALIGLLLSCGACATPEPRVSTVTNTVSVPVPVPCIAVTDIPIVPLPTPIDLQHATHKQKDAAQAADVNWLRDYARIADPLLRKCAAP